MSGFHQVLIGGYPGGGLTQDRKPALLANEAFSKLENSYVWRDRTKKRDGEVPIGRLTRVIFDGDLQTSGASPWTFNIYSQLSPAITPGNAQIVPGTVNIYIGATVTTGNITTPGYTISSDCTVYSTAHGLPNGAEITISGVVVNEGTGPATINGTWTINSVSTNTFNLQVDSHGWGTWASGGIWTYVSEGSGEQLIDQGDGTLATDPTTTTTGIINYTTGDVTITNGTSGTATKINFSYYPMLPVMGILKKDVSLLGIDSTVFFDTTYAYEYVNGFQELVTGTTWTGTNTDFFWAANYQGATPNLRYFFETNNNIDIVNTSYDPIRYYNNTTWTDLQPILANTPQSAASITLWQALIIIPYYGRLLALNTWEGVTGSTYTGATNYFARCRFSQLGDPTDQTSGWRSDIFGRGGFIDAPTNESIVSAAFFRNTLIVFFEYSTWQLRYVGEYGLPFIWERISSDFGAVSTFSPIVFDQGVMAVSDRGIIQAAANGLSRLDDQIPEQVFSFEIQNNAPNFVHGIRDFEKELVYWNYLDVSNSSKNQTYPNTTLIFNYKNNTWAKFRDTITCFGPAQFKFGITWDSLTTSWDSNVTWDNVDDQQYVDYIALGTQHGFINIYQNPDVKTEAPGSNTLYAPTMAITAVNFESGTAPLQVTIPSHNLANGEIIYIQNTLWMSGTPLVPTADPGLNNMIFSVTIPINSMTKEPDPDVITLSTWDFSSQNYDAIIINSTATYIGGGIVTLFPKMNIQGKDFNPFQSVGKQFKLSSIDFQMDANIYTPSIPATTVQLFVNSYLGEQANMINTNKELINSALESGFITAATKANPCQITSPDHSLLTGTQIYIANVQGMTQLNAVIYTITVVDANNFTLDGIDSSGYSTYTKGGTWNSTPVDGDTYIAGSEYAWYSFYSTQFGQYLRIGLTYDNDLMNQLATHQTTMELNAMMINFKPGGKLTN